MRISLALALVLGVAGPSAAEERPRAPARAETAAARPGGAGDAAPPGDDPWRLDLTIRDVGIGIGDSRRIIGVRLNYRDRAPHVVYGVDATIWAPSPGGRSGRVNGILVGAPLAIAGDVHGLGLGLGLGAEDGFDGVGVALLGLGAGGRLRGISLAGIGVGTGGALEGLGLGLVAVGAGERVRGLAVGGFGAGAGGEVDGVLIGGLGAGAGGRIRGLAVGGLGVGAGGDVTGALVGGLGAGAGGRIRGLAVGGLGAGSGEAIEGVALSLGGVGAPALRGLAAAPVVGGRTVAGVVLAPLYFQVDRAGSFTGVAVSALNRVMGEQRGVCIGIFNYAAALRGVQVGLLNYAGNNPGGLRLLPIANVHL